MKEIEKTFLASEFPEEVEDAESVEIYDLYVPDVRHPKLRLRRKGEEMFLTKKSPVAKDLSVQEEQTIVLGEGEFEALKQVEGKPLRKNRYVFQRDGLEIEVDVFLDDLEGLVLVDVEFESEDGKHEFEKPDFCLAEVTDLERFAGGMLAGKSFDDISNLLDSFSYQRLNLQS